MGGVRLAFDVLDAITSAIAAAYTRELQAIAASQPSAIHTVTAALLGGHLTPAMAHDAGIELADEYTVIALHLPPTATESGVARRIPYLLRSVLVDRRGPMTLALLSPRGGTVLLPVDDGFRDVELDGLVATLAEAVDVPITAAMGVADRNAVPGAAEETHRLLDTVIHLGYANGLYRFDDLALEVQLARPGPARDRLAAILAPLESYPELIRLLRSHYENGLDRRRTAQQFGVHANTIDNRLKSIARLTGCDPVSGDGVWMLRSALAARGFA